MGAIERILVPIDFGAASKRALGLAMTLASRFDAGITLFHAYMVPVSEYVYAYGLPWPMEDMSASVKAEIDKCVAEARKRYPRIETMVTWGEPAQKIIEMAGSCKADLIVMGTHGRRGFSRAILGSVAEKVVRLSPIPVLTVSSQEACEAKERAIADTHT